MIAPSKDPQHGGFANILIRVAQASVCGWSESMRIFLFMREPETPRQRLCKKIKEELAGSVGNLDRSDGCGIREGVEDLEP